MKNLNLLFFFIAIFSFSCVNEQSVADVEATEPSIEVDFEQEENSMHYYLIQLNGTSVSMEDLESFKNEINEFNEQNFGADKLRISSIYLGDSEQKEPVFVIRRFQNLAKVVSYDAAFSENFQSTFPMVFQVPISQSNYRKVLKSKTLEGYVEFYQKS